MLDDWLVLVAYVENLNNWRQAFLIFVYDLIIYIKNKNNQSIL
jgi:hypothetical protein